MDVVGRAYGVQAERYIELFGSTAQAHHDDLAFITRHLTDLPGPVVDVGCGPGHLTEYLRSLGVDATGIDLVPQFVDHARAIYPEGRYEVGSMTRLPAHDSSLAGILAWYSLIHLAPGDLDSVLAEFRRTIVPAGTIVAGFFDGDDVAPFDHKVTTAWTWPVHEMSARLREAGFTEIERWHRPAQQGRRSHAALAALAD